MTNTKPENAYFVISISKIVKEERAYSERIDPFSFKDSFAFFRCAFLYGEDFKLPHQSGVKAIINSCKDFLKSALKKYYSPHKKYSYLLSSLNRSNKPIFKDLGFFTFKS